MASEPESTPDTERKPFVPIKMNEAGSLFEEDSAPGDPSPIRIQDSDKLGSPTSVVGIHGPLCRGILQGHPYTNLASALVCRACGIRHEYPAATATYADLRRWFEEH